MQPHSCAIATLRHLRLIQRPRPRPPRDPLSSRHAHAAAAPRPHQPRPRPRPRPQASAPQPLPARTLHILKSAWHIARLPLALLLALSYGYGTISAPARVIGSSMAPTLAGRTPDTPGEWVLSWRRISHAAPTPLSSSPSTAEDAEAGDARAAVRGLAAAMPLRRGSVVVLTSPLSGAAAIKRVVGVAGDTVRPLAPPGRPRRDEDGSGAHAADREARAQMRAAYLDSLGRGGGQDGAGAELETDAEKDKEASGRRVPFQGRDGTLEPLTVPYGHVWVEGDNKDFSEDSNTYGPVSRSLVRGVVWARWVGLFSIVSTDFPGDGWEARMGGRLERRSGGEEVPVEWAE